MEIVNLLNQPELFGTYDQFLDDCQQGTLSDYSFVEPNYSDHDSDTGEQVRERPASRPQRASWRRIHCDYLSSHQEQSEHLAEHGAANCL